MELTRKQKILLAALSGVAVLLVVGLVLWINLDRSGDPVPEEPPLPSFSAAPTPAESPTPSPSPSPEPTPYYLPLVPDGTVKPTKEPSPSPTTEAAAPAVKADARIGTYHAKQKEFAAIGTQNGEAVAVLLVKVQPPAAEITAIPAETLATVYTLGPHAQVQAIDLAPIGTACARAVTEREGCWNLVWAIKNLSGYQPPHYLCCNLDCMDAFFEFVPAIETSGGAVDAAAFAAILSSSGEDRALRFAEVGVGVVRCLSEVSLWELPAFKSATKDAFSSSLSFLELLALMRTLKTVETFAVAVYDAANQKTASAGMPL